MKKKAKVEFAFTDDGFAMGLAYILRVLDQTAGCDALHWWSGVRRKFISEREAVERQRGGSTAADAKLLQTLSLTLARLQQMQKEFELLYLNVNSARVFFKDVWQGDAQETESSIQ